MKRFLTIFPSAMNVHLIKDVGMIPYVLKKELNYSSTLLCYNNDHYDYLAKEVKGLEVIFLKKIFGNQLFDVLYFLLFNSRKYDVIQVYHLLRSTLIWCFFFKLITLGKGKTYLKLDVDEGIMAYQPSKMVKFFVKNMSLITVESKYYYEQLNHKMQLGKRIAYIPNGFYDNRKRAVISFEKKENKIITVGRVGTVQKATDVLLNAFAKFALINKDWKLEIVGPIAADFNPFIEDYFKKNPELKDRVLFKDAITDRALLESCYQTAKIFVLSSKYEGFPIVLPEAASFGCYIISTNLPAVKDIIDGERYGAVFPIGDDAALANLLLKACNHQHSLKDIAQKIQQFAYASFYWPNICKNIDRLLWKN